MELAARFRQALGVLWVVTAVAQEQPRPAGVPEAALVNTGSPMRVPFLCTTADMQWAGMSCSREDPCPVYLELTTVESIGSQLIVAGNIHAETVTLDSVLLSSADAGKTWREAHPRIRGAGLDHVQFVDFANGWVSGEALSPLPQDPFLLITTDGGKSWRQQPIFAETRVGAIQQFFFSSKDEGSLVIDRGQGSKTERYELYESAGGGTTWTVKETSSRAMRLKNVPPQPASWRVRADGPTQSFRIEHEQAERWDAAASFAVSLGTCAPAATETAAPPEPVEPAVPARAPARPSRGRPKK